MKNRIGASFALLVALAIVVTAAASTRAASTGEVVPSAAWRQLLPEPREQDVLANRGTASVRTPLGAEALTATAVPTPPVQPPRTAKRLARPSARPSASPTRAVADDTRTVAGTASNYGGTAGFIGQPVVALPGALGGRYTGRVNGFVTVCAERCRRLPVVDWCQCYWGTSRQRVVDLSHEAWRAISDLPTSRGLMPVRVILD